MLANSKSCQPEPVEGGLPKNVIPASTSSCLTLLNFKTLPVSNCRLVEKETSMKKMP